MVRAALLLALVWRGADAAAPQPSVKWLIVGGGPHGVHIATRLLKEVDGVSLENLRIVDDEGRLLHKWKTRTASTGMRYLRSSASFHLDSDTPAGCGRGLKRYAERRSERGVFAKDYMRPLLKVFNDHCDHVLRETDLGEAHLRGTVTALLPDGDAAVEVRVRRHGGDAATVRAENVVLALGNDAPAYPDWVDPRLLRTGKLRHVLDDDDDGFKVRGSVAIVGGGLSAAHLALSLADGADVHVICRHEVREQQFDTHQDWMMTSEEASFMGRALTKRQLQFAGVRSFAERRAIVESERRAGTLPAAVSRGTGGLRYAIRNERLRWHRAEVEAATERDDGTVALSLSTGDDVAVDHVVLATGFAKGLPGRDLVDAVARRAGLDVGPCGYPAPSPSLRWHDRIFVAGALAELELGPSARNLAGARLASERIVAAAQRRGASSLPS